jgi:hypothetical protein
MVVDGTKGKLTQLYACSDREATEGWGVIRQLLELTLPRTFLQQLQSALEAHLETRQGDARGDDIEAQFKRYLPRWRASGHRKGGSGALWGGMR